MDKMDTTAVISITVAACTMVGFAIGVLSLIWAALKDSKRFKNNVLKIEAEIAELRKESRQESKDFHARLTLLKERYLQILTQSLQTKNK